MSGHEINLIKFKEYTLVTVRTFVELYPWFYMPTSVHKLLLHGTEIIAHALLPIGQMSEDAQESCNKYIKRYREDHAKMQQNKDNARSYFTSVSGIRSLHFKFKKIASKKIQILIIRSN